MKERFVLIGAGSAMFTRGLVADLIRSGMEAELALVDIDPHALQVAERLSAKMIAARKAPIQLSASLDRRQVLPGATVVICTIGVGGRRAWEQDVYIPRKYGIYMPVGDTVGPGGSSRALRMIPAMVEIAKDVLDLAPEALFFNYGNPMAPVCRAVHKATGANMVGLCHGVFDTGRYLAEKLGVPLKALNYTAVGINHLTWFVRVLAHGKDAMPDLRKIAAEIVAQAPASDLPFAEGLIGAAEHREGAFSSRLDHPFSWKLLLDFGAIPSALDRHVTEFFPQFFREGRYYGKRLGVDAFSFEGTIFYGDQEYQQMQEEAFSEQALDREHFEHAAGEHEQVIEIVQSIRQNLGKGYSANLPNKGQVPNLPAEAILEGPAVADSQGVRPILLPPLPAAIAGSLATRYLWVEAIVEAALENSREKFIQALVLDGAVHSLEQASALADELLRTQAQYLPWVNQPG
jgi:alpha-galactosidase